MKTLKYAMSGWFFLKWKILLIERDGGENCVCTAQMHMRDSYKTKHPKRYSTGHHLTQVATTTKLLQLLFFLPGQAVLGTGVGVSEARGVLRDAGKDLSDGRGHQASHRHLQGRRGVRAPVAFSSRGGWGTPGVACLLSYSF